MHTLNLRAAPFWIALIVPLLIAAAATSLILPQNWAVALLQDRASRSLGRELKVAGGAHLEFADGLALRFDDVSLANPERMDDSFITAEALRIDLSFWSLLGREAEFSAITLEKPVVELRIDQMNRASWPQPPQESAPLKIHLRDASLRFLDQRNAQRFALDGADITADFLATGELSATVAARIDGETARIEAYVKDISRLGPGSPADVSFTAPALKLAFNGRLSTSGALSLAGATSLSGGDLRRVLGWIGAAPGGATGLKSFTLSGALDAKGRAFALRGATASIDNMNARGEFELDALGEAVNINAVLASDVLDVDSYLPGAGWSQGDWGTADLGFEALRGLQAAVTLSTDMLVLRGAKAGPARIAATLSGGVLQAQIASQLVSEANVTLDGSGAVPAFSLTLNGEVPDAARLLGPIAGITAIDGKGTINAALTATGRTQQEMVATLKGTAELKLSEGAVNGIDVKSFLPEGSVFTDLSATLAAADGIIAVNTLNLKGLSATGEIDLLRHALDLRVGSAASGGFNVKGKWDSPTISSDIGSPYASGSGN